MPSIRIDNYSGDMITVFVDGKSYDIQDNEKQYTEQLEKGKHEICVHRTRIPMESTDYHESNNDSFSEKIQKNDKSLHSQLDGIFYVKTESSKMVITVNNKASLNDRLGLDVLFSGYSVTVTGGKIESEKHVFSNSSIKKGFLKYHLKEAFFPVGIGGLIIFIMGLYGLNGNIMGKTMNFGGTEFTYPLSIGVSIVGLGFIVYTIIVVINIIKTYKKYDNKTI